MNGGRDYTTWIPMLAALAIVACFALGVMALPREAYLGIYGWVSSMLPDSILRYLH
jgi:hypothetical protein